MVSDDIVKYLRLSRTRFNRHAEAADEIERLRKLTSELAQLMMPFAMLMTNEEQEKVIKAVRGE